MAEIIIPMAIALEECDANCCSLCDNLKCHRKKLHLLAYKPTIFI